MPALQEIVHTANSVEFIDFNGLMENYMKRIQAQLTVPTKLATKKQPIARRKKYWPRGIYRHLA
jgi:hypothetical protein